MSEVADPPVRARSLIGPGDLYPEEGAALVRERTDLIPDVAVVLGSGLGDAVAADVAAEHEFAFEGLPGFPPPSVPGHPGRMTLGELYGLTAAVFLGRVHYYEGHGVGSTTLISRLVTALGARTLILTNAAGGLDPAMRVGQLMLITDHLNAMGVNPLFGWKLPSGEPAFVDLSEVYDRRLLALARGAAEEAGIDVAQGVYAAVSGPSYETPAETAALRGMGADAVGMSTVPEAAAGAALGLSVLGISCITDVAGTELTHQEVLEAAAAAAPDLRAILEGVLRRMAKPDPERDQER